MFDAGAPSTQRVVDEMQIEAVRQRIDETAFRLAGSVDDADDLVANALVVMCDPDKRPWNHEKLTLPTHFGHVMRDLWIEQLRSARGRREVVDSDKADAAPARDATAADVALVEHETRVSLQRLGLALRASLAEDDPVATRVYDATCDGHETPAAIAKATGLSDKEVKNALQRIAYRGARIKEQDEAAFARRRASGAVAGRAPSKKERS